MLNEEEYYNEDFDEDIEGDEIMKDMELDEQDMNEDDNSQQTKDSKNNN